MLRKFEFNYIHKHPLTEQEFLLQIECNYFPGVSATFWQPDEEEAADILRIRYKGEILPDCGPILNLKTDEQYEAFYTILENEALKEYHKQNDHLRDE